MPAEEVGGAGRPFVSWTPPEGQKPEHTQLLEHHKTNNPISKWVIDLNKKLSKEIQMAKKYL